MNDIPDAMYQHSGVPQPAADSASKKKQDSKCIANKNDGICLTKEMCHKRGGIIGNICKHEKNQHCCTCEFFTFVPQFFEQISCSREH